MKQIETSVGVFEIVNDENEIFNISDFEKRYVELFNRYEYIVGDYFQEQLRLKGFKKEDAYRIPDYINEYFVTDSKFYILRNPNFDENYSIEEEE